MDGQSSEVLQGSDTLLYDTMVNTHHYTFIKTQRIYDNKSDPLT